MTSYFHLAPILLASKSVIEPGNFGRIIKLQGIAHPLYRREMAYEQVRQQSFCNRPSRLDCLFCLPTLEEAELYHTHIKGYESSILYEVESFENQPHIADANNAIQNCALPAFDLGIISYYWQGWSRSPDPRAVIMREVLLRQPVTVICKI